MNIRLQGTVIFMMVAMGLSFQAISQGTAWRIDSAQTLRDLKLLSSDSLQGRATGTEGGQMAQAYIQHRMMAIGLAAYVPDYLQHFQAKSRDERPLSAANVLGYIEGAMPGPTLVISAHYDHLGKIGGKIYNGADDNASGTAAILALAEYFSRHQPNYSIVFAAFDAEEVGLQGSRHFVESLVAEADSLVFNLNLDMISRSRSRQIFACGTHHYPYLKPWLVPLADSTHWHVNLRFGHDRRRSHNDDWTFSSDHASFYQAGVPFLYMGVEGHLDYHKPTDVYWSIDVDFYLSVIELVLETTLTLQDGLPEIASLQTGE